MGAASWFLVIGVSCLAAELFSRLPFEPVVARMARCGARAGWIISSRRISDHWKERVLPRYALRMAGHTLALTLCFAALAAVAGGVLFAVAAIAPDAGRFLASAKGLAVTFVIATAYYLLRRRLVRA